MENRFKTVVITGAAGFIGGALARHAIQAGYQVIGVDNFDREPEHQAWKSIDFLARINRDDFAKQPDVWLSKADAVFHLGARTDTFCLDTDLLNRLNLNYSKALGTQPFAVAFRSYMLRRQLCMEQENGATAKQSSTLPNCNR